MSVVHFLVHHASVLHGNILLNEVHHFEHNAGVVQHLVNQVAVVPHLALLQGAPGGCGVSHAALTDVRIHLVN